MPIDHTIPFLNPFSEFILQDVVEGLGPTKAASHLITGGCGEEAFRAPRDLFSQGVPPATQLDVEEAPLAEFLHFHRLGTGTESRLCTLRSCLPPSCPTPSTLLGEFPTTTAYYCI